MDKHVVNCSLGFTSATFLLSFSWLHEKLAKEGIPN